MHTHPDHQPNPPTSTSATTSAGHVATPAGSTNSAKPGPSDLAVAVMWAIVGALASGGGAIVGLVLSLSSASSCTGMFCELNEAFIAGLAGWGLGACFAVACSIGVGGGTWIDRTARALSTVFGVVALPVVLLLPAII